MTDLRGVLPAQRPPVDATVLDEPTSEVPMIRPPAEHHRNGEGARPDAFGPPTVAEPEPADTAELEPGDTGDPEPATIDLAADTTDLAADTTDLPADATDHAVDPAGLAADTTAELAADLTDQAETTDLAVETAELELPEPAETTESEPAPATDLELAVPAADIVEPEQMAEMAEMAEVAEVAEPASMAGPQPADLTAPQSVDLTGADPEPAIAVPVTSAAADPAAGTELVAAPAPTLTGQPPLATDTDRTDAVAGIPDQANPEVPTVVEPTPPHRISEMAKMTWSPAAPPLDGPEPARPLIDPEPEQSGPVAASALTAPAADLGAAPIDLAGSSTDLAGSSTDLADPATLAEPAATAPYPAAEPAEPPALSVPAAPPGRPGDVAESIIALWSQEAADRLRDQWRDLQVQFIDDPEAAVAGAKGLVTEAVHELADTLLEAQDALDPYRGDNRTDTESMRVAMRRYREFLERVLAL